MTDDKNLTAKSEIGNKDLLSKENTQIDLSNPNSIDVAGLSSEDQQQLILKAQESKIEIKKKADEAQIDIQGTNANLSNFNEVVRNSTKDGTSTTITHTQTSSTGRTEAVMGNTEKAASGKISRSGSGLEDNNLKLKVKPRRMCLGCTKPFALDEFADETSASGRGNLCVKCKAAPRAWHAWHNR